MNKKIISLSLLALLLGVVANVQSQQPPCSSNPLIFQIGLAHLKAVPHTKCMAPGQTYTIEIKRQANYPVAVDDVTVTVNPKADNPGDDSWLTNIKNSPDALKITIQVPAEAVEGDYKYEIHVKNVGTLDPVVRVKP